MWTDMDLSEAHRDELGFLRLDQVLQIIPLGRSTLYKMIEKGDFPSPCKVGHSSLWPRSEIKEWASKAKRSRHGSDDIV